MRSPAWPRRAPKCCISPAGPVIAITIAGPGGVVISPSSPVWIHLAEALAGSGDPHVAVRLLAHQPGTFRLGLKIQREPDFESSLVLAAVERALRVRFGFEADAMPSPTAASTRLLSKSGSRWIARPNRKVPG